MDKEFAPMIDKEEAEIVYDLLNKYSINIKNINIKLDNEKYVAGVFGNFDKEIKSHFKYNHFIESIYDLSKKTKTSIKLCIEAYQKVDIKKFNLLNNNISTYEEDAYYYMENALFREIILWDSLVQLYNLYGDFGYDVDKISYNSFFKKILIKNSNLLNIKEIYDYINKPFNLYFSKVDDGVHKYICEIRNRMTHRFSISISSFSENTEEGFCLRAMPDLIYRIAVDYNHVQKYLIEIIDSIIEKEYDISGKLF